jgi:hypothetical protein
MKLSRRGKRTKRTKRTKNIKCRRNTKRHLNKYRRKNTYRKHSHKLRKNKRVMRGGVENLDVVYEKKNVELEYTTSDDSLMNKARGLFNKLQRGNFSVLLSFNSGALNEDKSVFTESYTIDGTTGTSSNSKIIVKADVDADDKYYFILSMSKENKTFTVKFTLTVKSYKVSLVTYKKYTIMTEKKVNPSSHKLETRQRTHDLGETDTVFTLDEHDFNSNASSTEITYSDENDTDRREITISYDSENGQSITIKSKEGKTYTFPFPNYSTNYGNNYGLFSTVLRSCKEKVCSLMKKQIGKIKPLYKINTTTTPTPTVLQSNDNLQPSEVVSLDPTA